MIYDHRKMPATHCQDRPQLGLPAAPTYGALCGAIAHARVRVGRRENVPEAVFVPEEQHFHIPGKLGCFNADNAASDTTRLPSNFTNPYGFARARRKPMMGQALQ